jgi:hypothetical protein
MMNARTEQFFGYGRKELLGQTVDVLVPDHVRANHNLIARFLFGGASATDRFGKVLGEDAFLGIDQPRVRFAVAGWNYSLRMGS